MAQSVCLNTADQVFVYTSQHQTTSPKKDTSTLVFKEQSKEFSNDSKLSSLELHEFKSLQQSNNSSGYPTVDKTKIVGSHELPMQLRDVDVLNQLVPHQPDTSDIREIFFV